MVFLFCFGGLGLGALTVAEQQFQDNCIHMAAFTYFPLNQSVYLEPTSFGICTKHSWLGSHGVLSHYRALCILGLLLFFFLVVVYCKIPTASSQNSGTWGSQ